jgi:hypothetical protein
MKNHEDRTPSPCVVIHQGTVDEIPQWLDP